MGSPLIVLFYLCSYPHHSVDKFCDHDDELFPDLKNLSTKRNTRTCATSKQIKFTVNYDVTENRKLRPNYR